MENIGLHFLPLLKPTFSNISLKCPPISTSGLSHEIALVPGRLVNTIHTKVETCLHSRAWSLLSLCLCHARKWLLLLLLLSRFSRVWLFTIPWTAAHQAPLSMVCSRQEYWSGVPLPSPLVVNKEIELDMSLGKLREIVKDGEAWRAAVHVVAKSRLWLSNWT